MRGWRTKRRTVFRANWVLASFRLIVDRERYQNACQLQEKKSAMLVTSVVNGLQGLASAPKRNRLTAAAGRTEKRTIIAVALTLAFLSMGIYTYVAFTGGPAAY